MAIPGWVKSFAVSVIVVIVALWLYDNYRTYFPKLPQPTA